LLGYYGKLDSPELKDDIQDIVRDSDQVKKMLEVVSWDLLAKDRK
jgi:hypothetical protein